MSSQPPLKPEEIPMYSRTKAELSKLEEYPLSSLDYRLQLSLLKKVKRQDRLFGRLQKQGSSFNPHLATCSNNSWLLLLLMEKNKGIAHRKPQPQVYFLHRPPWA